jgi:ADP-glucose pyrophosphorylase
MENTRICKNAIVNYAILDENTVVGEGVKAGEPLDSGGNLTVFSRGSNL